MLCYGRLVDVVGVSINMVASLTGDWNRPLPKPVCGADLVQHAVRVCGVLCVVDCVKCEEAWCVCE